MSDPIETAILEKLAKLGPGKSIDPMNVAKAAQPEGWQRILPRVKSEAVMLAKQGKIVILRHNKPANPDDFRGVWRMRAPMPGDVRSRPTAAKPRPVRALRPAPPSRGPSARAASRGS